MKGIGAIALISSLLSGCAAPAARKACERQGLLIGTASHTDCTETLRRQWKAEARQDLGEGLALGAAIGAQVQAAPSAPVALGAAPISNSRLVSERWSSQGRLCSFTNGTVLNVGSGSCPNAISVAR